MAERAESAGGSGGQAAAGSAAAAGVSAEPGQGSAKERHAEVERSGEGQGGHPAQWERPNPPPIPERVLRKVLPRRAARALRRLGLDRRAWRQVGLGFLGLAVVVAAAWAVRPGAFDAAAKQRWTQLCLDYRNWYGPLTRGLSKADRVAMREMGLGEVLADLGRAEWDPRAIAGVDPGADLAVLAEHPTGRARSAEGIATTRSSSAAVGRVWRAFERWPVQVALREQQRAFAGAGWLGPATYIARLLADAPPRSGSPLAGVLLDMRRASQVGAAVLEAKAALRADAAALAGYDDAVLERFVREARRFDEPPEGVVGEGAGAAFAGFAERQQAYRAFGGRLLDAVRSPTFVDVDLTELRGAGASYAMLADPRAESAEVYRTWLAELGEYRRVGEDWRPEWAASLRERLAAVQRGIVELESGGHLAATELRGRYAAVGHRLAAVLDAPLVEADRAERSTDRVAVEAGVADLELAVERVLLADATERSMRGLRGEDGIAAAGGGAASPAVDAAWRRYRDQLVHRAERDGDVQTMGYLAEAARSRLARLLDPGDPGGMPVAPSFAAGGAGGGPDPQAAALWRALDDAAARRREAALAATVAGGLPLDEAAGSAERVDYIEALETLGDFAAWAERASDLLAGLHRLGEPAFREAGRTLADAAATWRKAKVLQDGRLAAAVEPLLRRIEAVAGLTGLSGGDGRATLVALASEANDPALAVGAWRRLGEVGWPHSVAELDREWQIQDRLTRLVRARLDPTTAAAFRDEAEAARLTRWTTAARAAASGPAFDDVAKRLAPYGLTPGVLPPRLGFDMRLWTLRRHVEALLPPAGQSTAQAAARVRVLTMAFIAQARPLDCHPAVRDLLRDLDAMTAPNATPREAPDAAGPATRGWRPDPDAPPGLAAFTRGDHRLAFRRVDAPDGPVYLATRELSVADTAAARATNAVGDGNGNATVALLRAGSPDDDWPGPRSWRYDPAARNLTPNSRGWLAPPTPYPDGLSPPDPTPQHPLNHVTPEAAVALADALGCTLPTVTQWQAARRSDPPQPDDTPNLRDQTWARYARATATPRRAAGTFAPAGSTPNPAAFYDLDDGSLWLAPPADTPADTPDPTRFQHLTGNVAELVTLRSVDPSILLDPTNGDPAARRAAFRRRFADAFAVVGGSALSPPDLPLDKPLPLAPRDLGRAFADVGLRPAFQPVTLTPTQQIARRLAQQPYLRDE